MILSVALFIEYGLGGVEESNIIRKAVEKTFAKGIKTIDIGGNASSEKITASILEEMSSEG